MPIEDENNIYGGFTIYAKWGEIQGTLSDQEDLKSALYEKVDKVEGKGLSTNDYTDEEKGKVATAIQGVKGDGTLITPDANMVVNVTPSNIGAVPKTRTVNGKALSGNITLSANDVGAVPTSRTVNGKALTGNISLSAGDVGAVPTSRTVNGKALTSNITLYTYGTGSPSGGSNGDLYFRYS